MSNALHITAEQIEEIGAAFARGFFREWAKSEAAMLEMAAAAADKLEADAPDDDKTRIADCRACWCDSCAAIEECENMLAGMKPDGIRPCPCIGCRDGMRFMPKSGDKPPCDGYIRLEGGGVNNG